jgi:taurine dioxygenase
MSHSHLEIIPTSGALGAELHGIDLAEPLAPATAKSIRNALAEHGVIFFREQKITPEQHIAFAERLAPININRFFKPAPGYAQIAEVRKEPEQDKNIGGAWHTDHSYDQMPALGSVLLAREVPVRGGDTMFASMWLAYEALSAGLKKTLEGMRAVHSSRHVFGAQARRQKDMGDRLLNADQATQDAVHPVIIRHPETGRKVLYVNRTFTTHFEGWTVEESRPLLEFLYAHGSRPEFQTRFQWREGSIAIWDNRSTWHLAVNDYHGERRLMHRITLEGTQIGGVH